MRTIDPIAEIRPAIDVTAIKRVAHQKLIELQDAERAESAAAEHHEKKREVAAARRLEMGRVLVEARKAWPARGPKAKGWGDFLRDLGLTTDTALNWMKLAGYAEDEVSRTGDGFREIPTYAEAGIKKSAPAREPVNEVTDEHREAAYRREVEASLPPRMEVQEKKTHELVEVASNARAALRVITERNIHLTDVTTSPDDFMRVKQLLIDIANLCLEELANAGVLDGKEQRRQMTLLDGGKK